MKKNLFIFHFNWANVVLYSFFISYGYFGAMTYGFNQGASYANLLFQIIIQLMIVLIPLILFSALSSKRLKLYDDSLSISFDEAMVFFASFICLFVFLFDRLNFSLFSDEISYAASSHGQSIFILFSLDQYINFPNNLNFQYLVQLSSFILLISIVFLYLIASKLSWRNKVIIISLIVLIGRLIFIAMGGNQSPHPPMHLIPSFVFGSLFGIRDIVFKTSHLFIYSIFITCLYKNIKVNLGQTLSIAIVFCISTIPIAVGMSSDIEHSIWSYYFFTIVMIELTINKSPNYIRLISLVSIGALMRQPVFLAIIPIICIALYDLMRTENKLNCFYTYFFKFLPLLLFFPFLIKNLFFGPPDNQFELSAADTGQISFFINQIEYSIQSGEVFQNAFLLFPVWCFFIIPIAFLDPFKSLIKVNFPFLFFFLALIILFYSIESGLWGLPKYQIEMTAPFVVVGLINFILFLAKKKTPLYFLVISLLCLTTINLSYYHSNNEYSTYRSTVLPYEYKEAYKYINEKGLSASTYSIGTTYGIMPEIMNGYSTNEVLIAKKIYDRLRGFKGVRKYSHKDISSIIKDKSISAVILGFSAHKDKYVEAFQLSGWRLSKKFGNAFNFNDGVIILER